jgi:3-deoxy-7-phosphoheptulonate synthase
LKKCNVKAYKLVSREHRPEWASGTRVVKVREARIGGEKPVVIAGPCAVESREHILAVAREVRDAGADLLRGGAFKPRTSPYDFQGLGEEGLEYLREAREETGLGIVTEALDIRHVELVAQTADMIQVGTRNMHHFPLLRELGKAGKPVLLKRGFGATLNEWLCAAEYIAVGGNEDIVLCERGVRYNPSGERAGLAIDYDIITKVRADSYLPVIVDPSHGTEDSEEVLPASRKSVGLGAHGLLVEVLPEGWERSRVRCDTEQSIYPSRLREIVEGVAQWRKKEA